MDDTKEVTTIASANTQVALISCMAADLVEAKQVLAENLGAGGLSEFDLQRIKIPSGGGIAFEISDLTGERSESKIRAVILFARDIRAYWPDSLDESGGGKPPSCHSNDGTVGLGDPGGVCRECPMAQFGSAKKGKGQACKQVKQLFVMRDGSDSILPENFMVPPTSLNAYKKFALMLGGRGVSVSGVVVEIGLVKVKSGDGFTYSQATFKPIRALAAEEVTKVRAFADLYRPLVGKAIDAQAASSEPGEPAWK